MIVNIEPPNPGIMAALKYNENKMDGSEGVRPGEDDTLENGHIVATRNLPEGRELDDEFRRLEMEAMKSRHSGPKIQNTSFHMSVNPSETDRKLSEEESVKLIDEIMDAMGYSKQPYRIYKHTDIPRMHYHVVSTRVGQDGKKIEDSFERLKLRKTLQEISKKYGFEIILNEAEKKKQNIKGISTKSVKSREEFYPSSVKTQTNTEEETGKAQNGPVRSFSRKETRPVAEQIKDICEDALKWHFSTFEQLQYLMLKRYNVLLENEKGHTEDHLVLSGTTPSGEIVTRLLTEQDLGISLLEEIKKKIEAENMSKRKEQKKRLETVARAAAEVARTYTEFQKIMEKKGIWTSISWTQDGKEAFGLTYLDRATKCAWKGSETETDLHWLKETAAEKGWKLEKEPLRLRMEKRNRQPSRKTTLTGEKTLSTPQTTTQKGSGRKKIHFNPVHQQAAGHSSVLYNHDDVLDNKRKDKRDDEPKQYVGE